MRERPLQIYVACGLMSCCKRRLLAGKVGGWRAGLFDLVSGNVSACREVPRSSLWASEYVQDRTGVLRCSPSGAILDNQASHAGYVLGVLTGFPYALGHHTNHQLLCARWS